ncbi:GlsB/YeaQ/YmgE family stress response membrane protein [Burkholderia latens]|uniref:GlsB/YeaQ/YmgE family stress response membrane protein n=1 Tax=Burkholderia latens TaxID=488446 RepID=A0A6H9T1S8_9BURK|nr:GlsB/YeaQ/YmgE family stress response membrane protein [Burkholderia latens]KAB0644802.1 GlsB/YeaQ/YmgE family stress response membrane protein [Burkholderia latens]VWB17192.1 transglycosylase associated protein family protein [Burkholderia latens]
MLTHIAIWLIVGGIAGWLAGLIVSGSGFGILIDIVVGVIGAVVGGWLASVFGISVGGGFLSSIIVAVVGAVILLFIIRLVRQM